MVSGWGFSITLDTLHQIASEVGEQSIISPAPAAYANAGGGDGLISCTARWAD
ncbi:hypothetical protein LN650_23560 [Klebsiella pneumoniae subsp. pneumoniae]|nr:hypothetical protein [Klebsiella pneumoniae subsp. pneumoniae]